MEAESESGQISKTIVEVYVETDSESEPYSSSEGDDGSEATLTAPEIGTEEEGEVLQQSIDPSSQDGAKAAIPPDITKDQVSPHPIIASTGIKIL